MEALGVEFVSKYLLGFLAHGQDFQIAGIVFQVIARIINDKALKDLPFILETPNELAGFKEEIAMLKSWRND